MVFDEKSQIIYVKSAFRFETYPLTKRLSFILPREPYSHSQNFGPIYFSVLPFLSRDRERDELELELELLDEPLDEEEPLLEELLELLEL